MSEQLELYEGIAKSPEVAEFLQENKREFERHEEWQKNHNGNYSYGVDTGFVDAASPEMHESPEKAVIRKYAHETLYNAIASLNESQRSRLIKRFWKNQSYREIAEEEGVDVHAVENSIHRALKNLHRTLAGTGISVADFAKPAEPVQYTKTTKRTQIRYEERKLKKREAEVMDNIIKAPVVSGIDGLEQCG